MMLLSLRPEFRKLRFQMIADTTLRNKLFSKPTNSRSFTSPVFFASFVMTT
jgi:hypothetical protein